MDGDLILTERVAEPGAVVDVEPCFELTPEALAYLAAHTEAASDARA